MVIKIGWFLFGSNLTSCFCPQPEPPLTRIPSHFVRSVLGLESHDIVKLFELHIYCTCTYRNEIRLHELVIGSTRVGIGIESADSGALLPQSANMLQVAMRSLVHYT